MPGFAPAAGRPGRQFIRHLLPSGLNIEVTGPLDDALSAIGAARVVIAPLRSGSGTRIKILEGWAARTARDRNFFSR